MWYPRVLLSQLLNGAGVVPVEFSLFHHPQHDPVKITHVTPWVHGGVMHKVLQVVEHVILVVVVRVVTE